jgi:hypothetical protein
MTRDANIEIPDFISALDKKVTLFQKHLDYILSPNEKIQVILFRRAARREGDEFCRTKGKKTTGKQSRFQRAHIFLSGLEKTAPELLLLCALVTTIAKLGENPDHLMLYSAIEIW